MGEYSGVSNSKKRLEREKLDQRYPGEISLVRLSDEELNDFIDYMSESYNGTYLDYLYSVIGPEKILLYLETMSEISVKIPPKKTIVKVIFYIKVYNYMKSRNFTDEAYKTASKLFGKRVFDLKRVVNKVKTVLENYKNEKL